MNQTDFIDWKRHPVTQAVFRQLYLRIQDLQEILSEQAGADPVKDREYVGAIKAYKDMLFIEYEGPPTEETQ